MCSLVVLEFTASLFPLLWYIWTLVMCSCVERNVIHMYCDGFDMRVSVRLRHRQLTCYSLLIKSSAYITEDLCVWI